MIAAVDTNILIWWVRETATPGQEEMVKRAGWLFESFDEDEVEVMIASITLAEFLSGSDAKSRARERQVAEESLIVQPFDARASEKAAELWAIGRGLPEYRNERNVLKADLLIVAAAVTGGASRIYSHDAKLRALARAAGLAALDLPTTAPHLFSD
ncbi:MAG: type II toxin-antitoxin system VapC family toxin [Phycisphaerales bacterium]